MVLALFSFVFLLPGAVVALNDWSVPCFQGQCSYDVRNGTAGGSVTLYGSTEAISDITPAAGWSIVYCNSSNSTLEIHAMCTGDTASCSHLYNGGAVGTVVRLPENCGTMPFARVAKEWTYQNQSVASNESANAKRQNNIGVRGLLVDTNFAAVDPVQNGNVSYVIQGSTTPGQNSDLLRPSRRLVERDSNDTISSMLNDFNVTKDSQQIVPFDKKANIFNDTLKCSVDDVDFTGSINVDVEAKGNLTVNYGFAAVGTIIPPNLSQFGLFADFSADLNGILTVDSGLEATFDTGRVTIFSIGLPGLDFEGILQLGPTFNIDLEGSATLDVDLDMSVDLAYNIDGAKLYFPPSAGDSSGSFAPGNSNLQLSASPNVASHATLEAHVIPNIQFGIDVASLANANVNLDLDTSGQLTFSLDAGTTVSTSTKYATNAADQFNGCVDLSTTLAVTAGADASLLDIFDKSTSVTLFSKTFDLFKKCFGNTSAKTATAYGYRRRHARDVLKRGATCPLANISTLATIVDGVIPASSITAE